MQIVICCFIYAALQWGDAVEAVIALTSCM